MQTNFKRLDNLITIQNKDLIVIASRPGIGKTSLLLNLINNISYEHQVTTLFFSFELSKKTVVDRLFKNGLIISEDVIAKKLHINDTPSLSIQDIENICRKFKEQYSIGLVIIDYLQLINEKLRFSFVSKRLKELTKELDIVIIISSQLSRNVDKRKSRKPMLSDFCNYKSIIDYADTILFLYKNSDYENKNNFDNLEIIVGKYRKRHM